MVTENYRVQCGESRWQLDPFHIPVLHNFLAVSTFPAFHKSLHQASSKIDLPIISYFSIFFTPSLPLSLLQTPSTCLTRQRRERNYTSNGDTTVNRFSCLHTPGARLQIRQNHTARQTRGHCPHCYSVSIGVSMLHSNHFLIFGVSSFPTISHSSQATFPTLVPLTLLIYILPHREKNERWSGLIKTTLVEGHEWTIHFSDFPMAHSLLSVRFQLQCCFLKELFTDPLWKVILLSTLSPSSVSFPYRMYHNGRDLSCPPHSPQQVLSKQSLNKLIPMGKLVLICWSFELCMSFSITPLAKIFPNSDHYNVNFSLYFSF